MRFKSLTLFTIILLPLLAFGQQRIKDIAGIRGVEERHLIGYGIVVGLDGTGDGRKSEFTIQAVTNMLMRMGITVPADQIRLKNVASVMVTATVPAFSNRGAQVDVTVSSMGDAKSLEGGILLMTPLNGTDTQVYAYAQGPVSLGGFNIETGTGERVRKNYALVGRVPSGGKLIRETQTEMVKENSLGVLLKQPDFTTAARIAEGINKKFNNEIAKALDAGEVSVSLPNEFQAPEKLISFVSQLESVAIETDRIAKIVINERTGTIVIGESVQVRPVAVAHGNLNIEIRSTPIVSQPNSFSQGETVVVPYTQTEVKTDDGKVMVIENAVNVKNVAQALNTLGVTPRDLIAIFQALKEAGALNAELVIM